MLSPSEYDHLTDQISDLYGRLELSIIEDMTRRIVRTGMVTESTKQQAERLQQAGLLYEDVIAEIAKNSDASAAMVRTLFEDAGVRSIRNDNRYYRAAGLEGIVKMSDAALQTLNAGYMKCLGNLQNLTLTTAVTTRELYLQACDLAYMQVSTGTMDYQAAIRHAVEFAAKDVDVLYPSGHKDQLDVAIRRAVLTGFGQTARKLSEINAGDMGCDLMEITAHAGARPAHAEWQGQIVSLSGRRGYLSKDDIGYGTGDGFGGWNCRHDWYPFFEGRSQRAYTEERLSELNEKHIEIDGKQYSDYEVSQMQRALERNIREKKRVAAGFAAAADAAADDQTAQAMRASFTAASVKLKAAEQELKDFLKQTGFLPDSSRVWVLGFGRSEAQKAVWAVRKSPIHLTDITKDATIQDKEAAFRNALKLGKIKKTIEPSKQQNHISGAPWRNQVKQAMASQSNPDPQKRKKPKSLLNAGLDPQALVNQFGGTGKITISRDGKTVNEFIVCPKPIGRTFDMKLGRYIETNVLQIKYCDGGTHIFPTVNKGDE